jgi:hypothetical protein
MRRLLPRLLALAIDVPVQHDAPAGERQRGAADARVLVRQVLDVLCARNTTNQQSGGQSKNSRELQHRKQWSTTSRGNRATH